jgi:hypothetical protein
MTNHIENPIGFSMEYVVVSCISESEVSTFQEAAQVKLAKDSQMQEICFDTGRGSDLSNLGVES